mgnify:CR=1 FL=1|jgi:predicted polyphosphate/ATP-dependent NAD kinase
MLRLGLILNPWAGIGGSLGLKGSDGDEIRAAAMAAGAVPRAAERLSRALQPLRPFADRLEILGFGGDMGQDLAQSLGFSYTPVGQAAHQPSQPEDTLAAASALRQEGVDLLLFAGGDGTARLIADAIGHSLPVLGIPAGVKMHSGVFAVSPEAAGEILTRLLTRHWVDLMERDVRDIDEEALRQSQVRARWYASMLVPELPELLQGVKNAGAQVDELAQDELAAGVAEDLEPGTLYILGPGSTTFAVARQLGLEASLLGVDLLLDAELIAKDLTAGQLLAQVTAHSGDVRLLVTAIGGQGHVFGRGNQQLSPELLRFLGRERVQVIATRDKLRALQGRPLLLDTNDPRLDQQWRGYWPIVCGYRETLLYPVGQGLGASEDSAP